MAKPTSTMTDQTSSWLRWGLVLLVAAAIVIALVVLPVQEYLRALLEWTRGLGFWGYLVLIAAYILATVLFLPGSILTLAAGFLFGVIAGSIVVSIGATLGACAAFLVGRYLAREKIEQKVTGSPKFSAIDQAVGDQGFKIVMLTRLSPVFPFNLLNYAFGLTRVRFGPYALASWLGMIPGTIMYVYLGSTAKNLAQVFAGNVEGGTGQTILKIVGLLATIVVTVIITRIARRSLKQSVPENQKEIVE